MTRVAWLMGCLNPALLCREETDDFILLLNDYSKTLLSGYISLLPSELILGL